MMEEKKKPRTSAAVKNRYAEKVYGTILVKLPKDLVNRFKEKCSKEGVSQAQVFRAAIEEYLR